jgi:hypothetical protein
MNKINWTKTFVLDDETRISCGYQKTNYGFRHLAVVRRGFYEKGKAKVCYYNRTWESYEYQTVVHKAIRNTFPKDAAEKHIAAIEEKKQDDGGLGFIAGIAKLGDIFCDKPEESNAWKIRMLKAGLENKGLNIPDDFDSLPEDEKQRRLDGAIESLTAEV